MRTLQLTLNSVSLFYFSEILLAEKRKSWECSLLSMSKTLHEIIDFFPLFNIHF